MAAFENSRGQRGAELPAELIAALSRNQNGYSGTTLQQNFTRRSSQESMDMNGVVDLTSGGATTSAPYTVKKEDPALPNSQGSFVPSMKAVELNGVPFSSAGLRSPNVHLNVQLNVQQSASQAVQNNTHTLQQPSYMSRRYSDPTDSNSAFVSGHEDEVGGVDADSEKDKGGKQNQVKLRKVSKAFAHSFVSNQG